MVEQASGSPPHLAVGIILKYSCVAGLRTPERLSESTAAWVDSKRRDLTQLMWDAAGIVRRRADMKAALQQLATLHHEVQVSASWIWPAGRHTLRGPSRERVSFVN